MGIRADSTVIYIEKGMHMTITQIIPYGKTRCKALLDEGFALLFYKSELGRYGITEGAELTEEYYEETLIPLFTGRAKERLVHLLEVSDKTESELRRKLKENWYPQEAIDGAIDWCKLRHYVDDERYIGNYLRNHAEGKSKTKLRYDLLGKGLDKELIDAYLEDAQVDEISQVMAELSKRGYRDDMAPKERQRIVAALARKGYSWGTIQSCIHSDDLLL